MKGSVTVFSAATLLMIGIAAAQGASVSGNLSITVQPGALALVLNPATVTLTCNTAAGTLVSQASTTGGDGNTVTFSMTGNVTDFAINSSTGAITVVAGGIHPADCNMSFTNVVTATQP
jgi:hypothetical protein